MVVQVLSFRLSYPDPGPHGPRRGISSTAAPGEYLSRCSQTAGHAAGVRAAARRGDPHRNDAILSTSAPTAVASGLQWSGRSPPPRYPSLVPPPPTAPGPPPT